MTDLGKQQVRALGKWLSTSLSPLKTVNQNLDGMESENGHEANQYFWRVYSSDLGRTKATTQLLLQEYDFYNSKTLKSNNIVHQDYRCDQEQPGTDKIRYDNRLREIARGLRQGLPKEYTYEEATTIYNNRQHPLYSNTNTTEKTSIPILETDDDGWNRIYSQWLTEVMQDISTLHNRTTDTTTQYDVLVVTHAALLRVFLQRFLGTDQLQQHPEVVYKYDNNDAGIPINNRLYVPNTSYTILNVELAIHPQQQFSLASPPLLGSNTQIHECNDPSRTVLLEDMATGRPIIQRVEIERFTSTDHYQYIH